MYKSELWDVLKRQRENMDTISDWIARTTKTNAKSMDEVAGEPSMSQDLAGRIRADT